MPRYVFGPTLQCSYASAHPIPGPKPIKRDAVVAFMSAEQADGGIRCRLSVEDGPDILRPELIYIHTSSTAPDLSLDPRQYLDFAAPVVSELVEAGETEVTILAAPPVHPGGDQDIPVWLVTVLEFAE